jgi:S1-C subfamily serine protease
MEKRSVRTEAHNMAQWYIRMRGRTLGPFNWDKMLELRDSRQLQAFHEVSADNRSWQTAGSIENLFPSKITARPSQMAPVPAAPAAVAAPVRSVPPKRSFPWVWLIVGAVCLMIFVLCGGIGGLLYMKYGATQAIDDKLANLTTAGIVEFSPHSDQAEIDRTLKETVGLVIAGAEVTRADGSRVQLPESTGTCFTLTKDGYLLTNQHVVNETDKLRHSHDRIEAESKLGIKIVPKLWVFFTREQKYEAEIIHISDDYDMAILKVDRKSNRCFALSSQNPEEVPRGMPVMVCGFPGVDRQAITTTEELDAAMRKKAARVVEQHLPDRAFDFSLRKGVVNVKPHDFKDDLWTKPAFCIQHDAEIFGGNSGGPLLREDGTVLGINTWKVTGGNDQIRFNYSITLPQLRKEIDKYIPGAMWR